MAPRRRRSRGHVRELPSGSYQAIVYAGVDPVTGEERRLRETAQTYDDAQAALARLLVQVDEDRHPKSAVTLTQAIAQWLDVVDLADTTRERYEDLIRLYIKPTFGDMPASKLDAELLERFYARLQRCRMLCNGRAGGGHTCRPLTSSTVRKIHFIIRGSLERAVRWRHLGVNKAALAVTPSPAASRPDRPPWRRPRGCSARPARPIRTGAAALADHGHRLAARRGKRAALGASRPGYSASA